MPELYDDDSPVIKKIIKVFNEDDFQNLFNLFNSKLIPYKVSAPFSFILEESFNEAKCPKCGCHTIASVVDFSSNEFISECVACALQFQTYIR